MDTHELPRLRLIAEDHEDLLLLSAHLQDSLMPLHSMRFHEKEGTFSSLCNRFCWEHDGKHYFEEQPLFHRVHTGLSFKHVTSVQHKGFDRDSMHHRHLNLLAIKAEEDTNSFKIHLLFSGESEIKLNVDKLYCHMGDLHHPWPTAKKPKHFDE